MINNKIKEIKELSNSNTLLLLEQVDGYNITYNEYNKELKQTQQQLLFYIKKIKNITQKQHYINKKLLKLKNQAIQFQN